VVGDLGRPTNAVEGAGAIYVADSARHRIVMLDGATYAVLLERALAAAPYALAYDASTQRLYVGLMGSGQVQALDETTLEPVGSVSLGGLGLPQDMALDAAAGKLYVAHALSPKYGALSVVDTASMAVVATLWGSPQQPLTGADAVRVDSARHLVFLAQSAGCLVLDGDDLALRETLALSPRLIDALAADALEGTLYLASDDGQVWTWRAATP
jgi:DNA-binding beta-propeller fold protein YncE